jgi:hypothetical protein
MASRRLSMASINASATGTGGSRVPRLSWARGRLAQLGERLPYKQEVAGSSPAPPTEEPAGKRRVPLYAAFACRADCPLLETILETLDGRRSSAARSMGNGRLVTKRSRAAAS